MFQAILPLSKYLKAKTVRIYDFAFALHSKISVAILIACTILVSAHQYFGKPIECWTDNKHLDFINLFCWTMGTYIISDPLGNAKKRSAAVGIFTEYQGSERLYMRYYQWVVMILLLQAIIFFFPAYLWKMWEGGLLNEICKGLERNCVPSEKDSKDQRSKLLKFFSTDYKRMHSGYAKKYIFCEALNLGICVLNLALMNLFFNGFWSNYMTAMSQIPAYNWEQWNERSSLVFPKLTKCDFTKFGFSGSISNLDVLCVLPQNILNEKLFAFLFVWFLILLVASAAHLTFRIIVACSMSARIIITQCSVGRNQSTQVRQLLDDMSYSEWFLLMRVESNVNPVIFADFIRDLFEVQKFKTLEILV